MKDNFMIGITLIVVGVGGLFFLGTLGILIVIVGIVFLFLPNRDKGQTRKAFKEKSINRPMKIQYLFYIIGVIFIFASVWYFAREFIADLPDAIKLLLLVFSVIISFSVAEIMRRYNF